jgi:hypothetical protein
MLRLNRAGSWKWIGSGGDGSGREGAPKVHFQATPIKGSGNSLMVQISSTIKGFLILTPLSACVQVVSKPKGFDIKYALFWNPAV